MKVLDGALEISGGLLVCALPDSGACSDFSVVNNIIAGVDTAGYSVPGHKCGDRATQRIFFNNTVHSV